MIKKLGGGVRLSLAQYRELAAFAQFASDLDEATRKQLDRGRLVTELMKQPQYAPLQVNEMAVTLFGVNNGYYDDVPVEKALAFEAALRAFLKSKYAALMANIEKDEGLVGRRREGAQCRRRRFQEERRVLGRRRHHFRSRLRTARWPGPRK